MALYVFTIEGDDYTRIAISPKDPSTMDGQEIDDMCIFKTYYTKDEIAIQGKKNFIMNTLRSGGSLVVDV